MKRLLALSLLSLLLVVSLAACAPANNTDGAIDLQFALNVGDQAAACGQSYPGLGADGTEISFTDLRFYISNIRLTNTQGEEIPLALTQDGIWQYANLALLDFEDGSAGCSEVGNSALNSHIVGTVPPGNYTAVSFDLGVPFELNHADSVAAPSPLNIQALWWGWQGGYKFLRIDMRTPMDMSATPEPAMDMSATPEGGEMDMGEAEGEMDMGEAHGAVAPNAWLIHLGSTGCESKDRASAPSQPCSNPNRVSITLSDFNPQSSQIVADISQLLKTVPLDTNTPQPPGCMSGLEDPDCAQLFVGLGLDLASGANAGAQQFFSLKNE